MLEAKKQVAGEEGSFLFKLKITALVAGVFLLLLLPVIAGPYLIHMMIWIFLYAYLGQCWNILGGYVGQLSFGHALFYGVGAYTSTLFFIHLGLTPWVGMFIGALLAGSLGLFISYLGFHFGLRSHFFALCTIAFAEIFRLFADTIQSVGAAQGLLVPLKGDAPFLFQFIGKTPFYFIALAMMLISMGIVYLLQKSKLGSYFIAIRENEDAAKALGVNTVMYKSMAGGISAFLTAFGGSFYAQYSLYIDPGGTFGIMTSVTILLNPIIGGMGTILGPFLGSLLLTPLSEIIQNLVGVGRSGVHMMIYGAILMAACIGIPNGLLPYIKQKLQANQ
jgi:branched-chain amino acid transport system permease protein